MPLGRRLGDSRVRGEFHASLCQESDAEAAFSAALASAREQESRWWELRTAVPLVRLWQGQSTVGEARELLVAIYNWFTEGFDTPDLMRARALRGKQPLDCLECPHPHHRPVQVAR